MAKGKVATLPAAAVVALLALALALNGVSAAVNSNPDFTGPASLTVLHGDVLVRHGDSAEVPALDGQALQAGDVVRTEVAARAVITYFDGSHVALEPATELAIETLTGSSAGDIVVLMRQTAGRTWHVVTRALSASSRYEVRTPAATATVRGTAFAVDYDGTMRVTTTEGVVRTGNARGYVDVMPGRTTAARVDAAPVEPVTAPAPARVVTVVVSASNATVVDSAGRPIVVKDSKIVRAVPYSTAERRADGSVVVTMPDVPSGTISSKVSTSASAVDIKVQVREGDRVVSEATERREVRDGTAKGGVELAPDGRVTPLDDDEARRKPDPKISRPAAPPAAPDKVAAKEAAPARPADVARIAPAPVKPEAPKLASVPAAQEKSAPRTQGEGAKGAPVAVAPSSGAGKKADAKKKESVAAPATQRMAPPGAAPVETSGASEKSEAAKVDGGSGGTDGAKEKDRSGSGEAQRQPSAPRTVPAAVAASAVVETRVETRTERVEAAMFDVHGGSSTEAAVKDEQRAPSGEGARSPSEDAKNEDARRQDPPKGGSTRAETRAAEERKSHETKQQDEPSQSDAANPK